MDTFIFIQPPLQSIDQVINEVQWESNAWSL